MADGDERNIKQKVRNFVIGESECRIATIAKEIMSFPQAHLLVQHWPELAARLGTDWVEIATLKMFVRLGLYTTWEILVTILTAWRSRIAEEATLGSLIHKFKDKFNGQVNLKGIGRKLEKYFIDQERNSADNSTSQRGSHISLGGNSDRFESANRSEISGLISPIQDDPYNGWRFSRRWSCFILCLFLIAFGLVLASIGFLTWYVIVKVTIASEAETFVGSLEKPVLMSLPIKTDIKIEASSYNEYIKFLDNIDIKNVKGISLNISLNNHLDWKHDLVLIGKDLVNVLIVDGHIDLDTLISLLDQANNITELHIGNTGDRLCNHVRNQSLSKSMRSTQYRLPKLAKLVLTEAASCAEIFNVIANSIQLSSLSEFKIIDGVLDDINILHVQTLLHKVHNSIQSIEIGAIKLTDKYFYPPNTTFTHVTRLKLNLVYNNDKNITPFNSFAVNSNFINAFVGLDYFKNKANMSYSEFLILLGHTNLKKLDVKILVHRNVYNKDMSTVYLGQNLEKVEIHLFFYNGHCPAKLELRLLGIYKLQEMVKEICFSSNCGIDFRKNQVSNPKSSLDVLKHMCTHS